MTTQSKGHMYNDYLEVEVDRGFISLLDATILQGASSDDDFLSRKF